MSNIYCHPHLQLTKQRLAGLHHSKFINWSLETMKLKGKVSLAALVSLGNQKQTKLKLVPENK
jgi:hypothetical protein